MDGHRFDGLTRALASGLSRRQALTVLGAALSGSGLLDAFREGTNALGRRAKRRCKRAGGAICSAGTKRECCSPNGECLNGACQCNPAANDCPQDNFAQCSCAMTISGESACCDSESCCDFDSTCDSNLDCLQKGSVCTVCGFDEGGTPIYKCTNPCIPGGSSA